MAAGERHSLALTAIGRVMAWGYNGYGETNVPPSLASHQGTAIAGGGEFSLAVIAAQAVSGVVPGSGPVAGGQSVTVIGRGFTDAGSVRFATTFAPSFTVVSDTRIRVVVPPHPGGTVNVFVRGPGGTSSRTPTDRYVYR